MDGIMERKMKLIVQTTIEMPLPKITEEMKDGWYNGAEIEINSRDNH